MKNLNSSVMFSSYERFISFFQLLVNGFSVISECSSTLYVGLACTAPPTNTNFRLTFLLNFTKQALYEDLPV